jgi:Flp pilus assembly pilin Flp
MRKISLIVLDAAVKAGLRVRFACERAQNTVEYAFIVALIALGIIAGMQAAASEINNVFVQIATTISTAMAQGSSGNGSN